MPISFTCPHCLNEMLVSDDYAGQTGPCAHCQETITLPGQEQPGSPPVGVQQNPYAQPMQGAIQPQPGHPVRTSEAKESELGMRMLLPVDRSGLAIIAGYAGLFSVLCFAAPIALILGILAVRDIKKNPKKHGLVRAWFAIVMGALFTFIPLIVLLIMALGG